MAKQLIGKVKGDTGKAATVDLLKTDGMLTITSTDDRGTQTASIQLGEGVQSDWASTNTDSLAYIRNKPEFAEVATTGDYDTLINTPTNVSEFTNDAGYLTNTDTVVVVNSTTEPTTLSVGQYWEQQYN